ncbi:MAG: hypothetical protein ACK5X8_20245, partial [Planctomyces sp.]
RAGKPELQKFVPIRVHSWFKNTRSEDPAGQISGWKARATKIRVHSCPFVVQNNNTREDPSGQISGWKARATKIRVHSRSFVVQYDNTRKDPAGQISGWKALAT